MLGRTANGLYWMFRYIERAENIARLVDAGLRMSLTRSGTGDDNWDGVLQSAGVREAYDEGHSKLTGPDAVDDEWEIVPTYDAKCLVAYLMSLDQSNELKEAKLLSAPAPAPAPASSPAASPAAAKEEKK